jgi:hypothetical protein
MSGDTEDCEDKKMDHPCKETCSGWKQGYQNGLSEKVALRLQELKRLTEQVSEYRTAMLKEIHGAGSMSGPIYHGHIRKVLGLPAEGNGREITQPCPYPAGHPCEDCQRDQNRPSGSERKTE